MVILLNDRVMYRTQGTLYILGNRCVFNKKKEEEEAPQPHIPLLGWESHQLVGQEDPVE